MSMTLMPKQDPYITVAVLTTQDDPPHTHTQSHLQQVDIIGAQPLEAGIH